MSSRARIDETMTVVADEESVFGAVESVMAPLGYAAGRVGPTALQVIKAVPGIFGRRISMCTVTATPSGVGTVVSLTGRLLQPDLAMLRAVLGEGMAPLAKSVPTGGILAPRIEQEPIAVTFTGSDPASGSRTPPATSVAPLAPSGLDLSPPLPALATDSAAPAASVPIDPPSDATVGRDVLRAMGAPAPVLRFDDGDRIQLVARCIVGRDPMRSTPEDAHAILMTVRDQGASVSKTHFAVWSEGSEVWVEDRHSTNGTKLIGDGLDRPVLPGCPQRVPLGTTVRFGERHVEISGGW